MVFPILFILEFRPNVYIYRFGLVRALLHELEHEVAATIVGLEFKDFYESMFGPSGTWINQIRSLFQGVVTSSAGPLADLAIGLIALFVILPRLNKWGAQIS